MAWLIALAVVILIAIIWYVRREQLTIGAPVVVAAEQMYWDGSAMKPCSQCFDSKECPSCPQFALYTQPQRPIESFEVPTPRYPIMPSPQDAWAAALNSKDSVIDYDVYDADSARLAAPMLYDLDADYVTSREKMGACNTLSRSNRARAPSIGNVDVSVLGVRNDDIFDGDRAVVRSKRLCRNSSVPFTGRTACNAVNNPVTNLLYGNGNITHLPINAKPAVDCEFMSYNGYIYKQRCDSQW